MTFGKFRLSLGYQVLIAVLLGVLVGIFFGPAAKLLEPIGNVYIMLLQMIALPYISFTLIHGLGSMTPDLAKKLFRKGWPFWIGLWALIFFIIYLSSLLIPPPVTAFVNADGDSENSMLTKNFLSYLVPENPFYDLANNIVPAIAIFGLIIGVSLMHLEKKEPLLSILERANQVMEKILKWIALLSPLGIFAHIAVAAGTVYFEDLIAIEFYLIAFILICLVMVIWVLPVILSSLTPLSYREVLDAFKTVCILPFATAVPTIALPFIILYMQRLGEKHASGDKGFHSTSQTVMPFCYSFGQVGNCLILFYILFLSFYYRHPFGPTEKGLLSVLTIPLSVGSSGSSLNAVSFLIDQLNFPQEAVSLFTETMAITLNFQVLLSVASVLTFIILVLYAYYGILEVKVKKLCFHLSTIFTVLIAVVWGGKEWIQLRDNYQDLYLNLAMQDVIPNPVTASFLKEGNFGTSRHFGEADARSQPLGDILKTGVLKVGYDPRNMPYCYWNAKKELVGYDVAFAYQLARDLDCKLEFIPLNIYQLGAELWDGFYDLGIGAVVMDEERILQIDFTHPYTQQDAVLIVPKKKRSLFKNLIEVQTTPNLRFGAVGGFIPIVQRHFPLGRYIRGGDRYKELETGEIDAWVSAHTPAFAWSLAYPQFVVIDYDGLIGKLYFAYALRHQASDWASFLNNWLILKEQSGFTQRMNSYWINGENPEIRPPRWSIIRNVLGWVR